MFFLLFALCSSHKHRHGGERAAPRHDAQAPPHPGAQSRHPPHPPRPPGPSHKPRPPQHETPYYHYGDDYNDEVDYSTHFVLFIVVVIVLIAITISCCCACYACFRKNRNATRPHRHQHAQNMNDIPPIADNVDNSRSAQPDIMPVYYPYPAPVQGNPGIAPQYAPQQILLPQYPPQMPQYPPHMPQYQVQYPPQPMYAVPPFIDPRYPQQVQVPLQTVPVQQVNQQPRL